MMHDDDEITKRTFLLHFIVSRHPSISFSYSLITPLLFSASAVPFQRGDILLPLPIPDPFLFSLIGKELLTLFSSFLVGDGVIPLSFTLAFQNHQYVLFSAVLTRTGTGQLPPRHLRQLPLQPLHLRARHLGQSIRLLLFVSSILLY